MSASNLQRNSIRFHRKTFGTNIQIVDNGTRADRYNSFDNGITFTQNPVAENERICMKIADYDEKGNWLGSLAIGFTDIDPGTLSRQDLFKSALPNLCRMTGVSYLKRIFDNLRKDVIITFYYDQNGAYYILDGKEQAICTNIGSKKALWGVIDIYGNVKGVCFITPPTTVDSSQEFFRKFNHKPDRLPIRHFTTINQENLQSIEFSDTHGPELELFCENKVALRRKITGIRRPYLFINCLMRSTDEVYIRILSLNHNFRTSCIFGVTNAEKSVFIDGFNRLPDGDIMALYDRSEFWAFNPDAFSGELEELDEFRIVFEPNGDIRLCRNNEPSSTSKIILCVDPQLKFYPFFYLNGAVTALSIFAFVSTTRLDRRRAAHEEANEDDGLCQICFENPANCVMMDCGHVFFCEQCKDIYCGGKDGKRCPICRKEYTEIIVINEN